MTVVVFAVSNFIQPILPPEVNSTLILLFASLVGVLGVFAAANEVVDFVTKILGAFHNPGHCKELNKATDTKLAFITIDTRPLLGGNGKVQIVPYCQFNNVGDLLDAIWLSFGDTIPPFTYEESWILRDIDTGRILTDIRRKTISGKPLSDERSLNELGIKPGMELEAIAVNKGL